MARSSARTYIIINMFMIVISTNRGERRGVGAPNFCLDIALELMQIV